MAAWFAYPEHRRDELEYRGVDGHRALQHVVGDAGADDVEIAVNRLIAAGLEIGGPWSLARVGVVDDFHQSVRFPRLDAGLVGK